jgi:hypothetical protein
MFLMFRPSLKGPKTASTNSGIIYTDSPVLNFTGTAVGDGTGEGVRVGAGVNVGVLLNIGNASWINPEHPERQADNKIKTNRAMGLLFTAPS